MVLEIIIPVIAAGVIVLGAALVQLHVHRDKLLEDHMNQNDKELEVLDALRFNLESFAARGRARADKTVHVLFPDDVAWLRSRFHKTKHVLFGDISDAYLKIVRSGDMDTVFTDAEKEKGRVCDLTDLQKVVTEEFHDMLRERHITETRPASWWLRWNWRKYLWKREIGL